MHNFMSWLARADNFTQQQQEFEKILEMQQEFDKDALKPLASSVQSIVGEAVATFNMSLDNFGRSTFMRESLPQALCGQFDSHTTAILQPVMQEIHQVLPPTFVSVSLETKADAELMALINFELSVEHFSKAAEWAKKIHDDRLRIQLEIAHCLIMHVKYQAVIVRLCHEKLDPVDARHRRATAEQVDALKAGRARLDALMMMDFPVTTDAAPLYHCKVLDNLMDFSAVKDSAQAESALTEQKFMEAWTATGERLTHAIRTIRPAWEPHEQVILSTPSVVQAFLGLDPKRCAALPAVCLELKNHMTIVKSLPGKRLVSVEVLKAANDSVMFGMLTFKWVTIR